MRRASPAGPTWCAAIMNSPAATSGWSAESSASAAKARPIRCSTSAPRRRSRAWMPASSSAARASSPRSRFASVPAAAAGRTAVAHPVRHVDHQPVGARGAAAGIGGRGASVGLRQPRPDQRGAPRGRARPAADPAGRRRDRAEDRDLRGQICRPQIVRRSDHRRAGLFRDARRISGDALALAPVVDLDHRPDQRQRPRVRRIIEQRLRRRERPANWMLRYAE